MASIPASPWAILSAALLLVGCDEPSGPAFYVENSFENSNIQIEDSSFVGMGPITPSDDSEEVDDAAEERDFYFLVPYDEDPQPAKDILVFKTDIKRADVFFLVEATEGMEGEIDNLADSLSSHIIPSISDLIPDVWFGSGHFGDYPRYPFGKSDDTPFQLDQRTTFDTAAAQTAVSALAANLGHGRDRFASHVPALWATATGLGLGSYGRDTTSCNFAEVGYPCFRPGAVPIVVLITNAPFHNGPQGDAPYYGLSPDPPTYQEAITALNSIHAKVLGIWSEGSWGPVQRDVEHVAADTGAVDAAGDPIALRVDRNGDGLGERVVSAVEALARSAPMRLAAAARDDPTDAVDATGFIARIVPSAAGGITHPTDPAAICAGGLPTEDTGGDEKPDLFSAVLPGTPVCFDIILRKNSFVKPLPVPQLFKAHIDLWGDNVTLLDTREVFFLVPAEKPGVR